MKNLLIILLLALPVVWWVENPSEASGLVSKTTEWSKSVAARLLSHQGKQADSSDRVQIPKNVELPIGVYVLRESITAKFLPASGTIAKGTKVKIVGEGEGKKLVTD